MLQVIYLFNDNLTLIKQLNNRLSLLSCHTFVVGLEVCTLVVNVAVMVIDSIYSSSSFNML